VTSTSAPQCTDRQSLDGDWQIVFDRENVGVERGWHEPAVFAELSARTIPVPSCWEEHEEDYEGVAWYAREVGAPAEWQGRHVRLRFDAVNYYAEVWLNGDMVGGEESGFTPVELDVTQLLRYGEANTLIVRVTGSAVRSERVDRYVCNEVAHWRGAYVGGIWQSVRLIATDAVFVRDVFVEPRLGSSEAVVNVEVANEMFQPMPEPGAVEPVGPGRGPMVASPIRSRKVTMTVSIEPAGVRSAPPLGASHPRRVSGRVIASPTPEEGAMTGALQTKTVDLVVPPGGLTVSETLKLDTAIPWSPDNPHLCRATVQLTEEGGEIHCESVRFGMRELTIEGTNFTLNGERVFIKGAFWEGLYPVTLAHPRDPEIVRREIRMAKEAGFNLLRPWRMPPSPMILDLADEMGMMLVGSPAIACMGYWPEETPRMEHHWAKALTGMVRRDRNHPSVVMWETTNEIVRKSMLIRRHRVSLAARALDPTRMILDESGGARSVWGSFVYPPYSTEPTPVDDRHLYCRAPVEHAVYEQLRTYGADGQPVLVSEVGYGSFPDIVANVARYRHEGNPKTPDYRYHHELLESLEQVMDEHNLRELFPDATALCRSTQEIQALGNAQQLEALRINPKAGGYCIHAFTDGDWVVGAGVLDMWREPKPLFDALKMVQKPLHLALRVTPGNVYASRGATLSVTAVNDGPAIEGDLRVTVCAADGGELWASTTPVAIPQCVTPLLEEPLATDEWSGTCVATAQLVSNGSIVVEARAELRVFADADAAPGVDALTIIDAKGALRTYCGAHGVTVRAFDSSGSIDGPAFVAPQDAWNEAELARLVQLMDWIERGGVAVWLDPPAAFEDHGQPVYRDPRINFMVRFQQGKERIAGPRPNFLIQTGVFPLGLRCRSAQGLWIPVGHYARKHPAFDGLPIEGFMNAVWQNVAARRTLTNLPGPCIAGSVSWDSYHDYRAETKCWHGIDLGTLRHGEGTMILSTLNILPHLGKDPVADRMLRNLIAFATSLQGEVAPPSSDLSIKTADRVAAYRRLRDEWDAKLGAAEAEPWP